MAAKEVVPVLLFILEITKYDFYFYSQPAERLLRYPKYPAL